MKNPAQQNNVFDLLTKYYNNIEHAKQVQKLALMLFDSTYGLLHNYSNKERQLLEAASLLHDIGRHIANEHHNKHSYYLIMENGIDGFEKEDLALIANIARYHRGSMPKKEHENFSVLPDKKHRKIVKRLASFLRIADGLDREKKSLINSLSCSFDESSNILSITLTPISEEFSADYRLFQNKKELLENAFKTQVVFLINKL